MLGSLGVGSTRYRGSQCPPVCGPSSFLSTSAAPVHIGASSLSAALAAAPDRRGDGRLVSNGPVAGVGQMRFNVAHLAEGTFTDKTVKNMHQAVLEAKTNAQWRQMMEDIRREGRRVGAIGWKDYIGEVRWFDHWYRNRHPIDYIRDPHQVELVQAPMLVYSKSGGDCDDSSALTAASLGALGAPHRFRTYRADPRRPDEWSHVAAQIWVPNHGWVNEDLTILGATAGFEPQGFVYKDWPEPRY